MESNNFRIVGSNTPIRARVSKQGKRKTGKPIYVILIPMDYNDIFQPHDLVEIRRVET